MQWFHHHLVIWKEYRCLRMSLKRMRCLKRSFHNTVYMMKEHPSYGDSILKKYIVNDSTETLMERFSLLQNCNSKYLLKYHNAQQVDNELSVRRILKK